MRKSIDTAWRIGVSLATLAAGGVGCNNVNIHVNAGERIRQDTGQTCVVTNDYIARLMRSSQSIGTIVISQVEPKDENEAAKSPSCHTGSLIR